MQCYSEDDDGIHCGNHNVADFKFFVPYTLIAVKHKAERVDVVDDHYHLVVVVIIGRVSRTIELDLMGINVGLGN